MPSCPGCGTANPDGSRFCNRCGTALHKAPAPSDVIFAGRLRHRAYWGEYLGWGLLSLVGIGIPFLLWRIAKTRSEHWQIDDEHVQWTRGVFSRRTDSLALWRVRDIVHEQSFVERLFGDGRVALVSSDATTPSLTIKGLPDHQRIFERLRDAIERARRRNRVVGVEETGLPPGPTA